MISLLAAAGGLSPKLVSLHDFAFGCRCRLVSAKSEIMETSLGNKAAAAAKSEVMKGDKLGETSRQRQPKAKS